MSAKRLNGKEVAEAVRSRIAKECETFRQESGITPCLAVILVGEDPASVSYVTGKKAACEEVGFLHKDYNLPENTTEEALKALVMQLNADKAVHGILVQVPLPPGIDADAVIATISPEKDVDGFHPMNVGNLLLGRPGFISCTPLGILEILDYYQIPTKGKKVVIVGRSNIVGKPMAMLLVQKGRDATVTLCHTQTPDLKSETLIADILIVATGHPHTVSADMICPGAVVIDVGVNRIIDETRERGWRLVGDVDYAEAKEVASAITPVPGGVGPMTITMLMSNTLKGAKKYGVR